jgi:hypothetical protein
MSWTKKLKKAQELSNLWTDLEDSMGEMAAFHVACEQMNIDPDDGWQLIFSLAEWQEKTGKIVYDQA